MGQILHGRARTTRETRREIQNSQQSLQKLAQKYGVNFKTVAKWKKREYTHDAPMGPKQRRSTTLTIEQEAAILAFRKHTLLPLDDCLYALQEAIPQLTRSSLHRCLQRHKVSTLPKDEGSKQQGKKAFKEYPIGYFHLDITTLHTAQGRLYLFVGIDRSSKYVYVELHSKMTREIAANFLSHLIQAVPYQVDIVLTDNGIQFTPRAQDIYTNNHPFQRVCAAHGIAHRLTQVGHPWTNGQVERMNGLLKSATVKRYYYNTHQCLKKHLDSFVMAYNHGKRLKALKGLTPYEYILATWEKEPDRFNSNPRYFNVGLNN